MPPSNGGRVPVIRGSLPFFCLRERKELATPGLCRTVYSGEPIGFQVVFSLSLLSLSVCLSHSSQAQAFSNHKRPPRITGLPFPSLRPLESGALAGHLVPRGREAQEEASRSSAPWTVESSSFVCESGGRVPAHEVVISPSMEVCKRLWQVVSWGFSHQAESQYPYCLVCKRSITALSSQGRVWMK